MGGVLLVTTLWLSSPPPPASSGAEGPTHDWSQMAPGEGDRPQAVTDRLCRSHCSGPAPLPASPPPRGCREPWRAGAPEPGRLGLCLSLWLARTCHGISEWVSHSLGRVHLCICSRKRGENIALPPGIFPVILNKCHVFVPGTELRIRPCTEADAAPRRSMAAASPPLLACGAQKPRRSAASEKLPEHTRSPQTKTPLWVLLSTVWRPAEWLCSLRIENVKRKKKCKPKISAGKARIRPPRAAPAACPGGQGGRAEHRGASPGKRVSLRPCCVTSRSQDSGARNCSVSSCSRAGPGQRGPLADLGLGRSADLSQARRAAVPRRGEGWRRAGLGDGLLPPVELRLGEASSGRFMRPEVGVCGRVETQALSWHTGVCAPPARRPVPTPGLRKQTPHPAPALWEEL